MYINRNLTSNIYEMNTSARKVPTNIKAYYPLSQFVVRNSFSNGHKKDFHFNEVLTIIEEVENAERFQGKYKTSSYYYNGILIKGTESTESKPHLPKNCEY